MNACPKTAGQRLREELHEPNRKTHVRSRLLSHTEMFDKEKQSTNGYYPVNQWTEEVVKGSALIYFHSSPIHAL